MKKIKPELVPCPMCKGEGEVPASRKALSQERKKIIEALATRGGYSYREITTLLGLKSTNSVTRALKQPKKNNN